MDIVSSRLNIDNDKLYAYAASAARLLPPDGESAARDDLRRLRRDFGALRRFHAALCERDGEEAVSGAEEWILDNYYLIVRELRAAQSALRSLGSMRGSGGETLVFALCRSLLRAGGGKLSEERLRCYLDGFQSVCVLRQSELASLGVYLRCAVISAIEEVCRAMERGEDESGYCARLLGALFAALRSLGSMDLAALCERVNIPGMILALDATGEYSRMDALTKQSYLERLETLALRDGREPQELARSLAERSQREGVHIGALLFSERGAMRAELYFGAMTALCAALALLVGYRLGFLAALFLLPPLSGAVSQLGDFLLSRFIRPRRLPRMDMHSGIPPEGRTVCVISTLLSSEDSARESARKLERLFHACGGARTKGALCFGLLADLSAADQAETEADARILAAARSEIEALNARLGGAFCLFTRPRSFDGERYSGRERKRGALCALARLMAGKDSELRCFGEEAAVRGARFILTLDSDTEIYPGSVEELIGAALHPLNRAQTDEGRGTVVRGHGVIQPRVSVTLDSAIRTDFSLIYAGSGGSDPYGALCGELYMDAFDAGGFTGKGLLDAAALLACTEERFAGKGILSHDAPEGAYLRGALMGDEEFYDAFPPSPAAYFRRLHRWVRGDWQNLRFLFAPELPAAERFRFFAKLRDSLIPVATLGALLLGFLRRGLAGEAALAATLCLLSDLVLALGGELRRRNPRRARRSTRVLAGLGGAIVKSFMRLWLLPWEAWICLSAALTAIWRMAVSHRRLLQWETAAQSETRDGSPGAYARLMAPVLPVGLGAMCFSATVIGRAAGLLWLLSPLAAWALSLPSAAPRTLSAPDEAYLRACAEDTWRYFSALCRKEENYLPPDNYQSQPPKAAAHSVSPTNLGLAMTAAVAACDLELLSADEALLFIGRLLDTAERMPRYRGHFYNWYDTRTLQVLQPPYVSTVDSGNLCAALLTCAAFAAEKGGDALAARLKKLAAEMDYSFLYDTSRSLFVICYDTLRSRGAGGWYDLMASEAMLTSYLALGRGEAPRRHWRALGRARLGKDGYSGLASWTGTMFEYLMPTLFLPLQKGSLLYESCRFCLFAQRRRVMPGTPWGISESAFFSLDASGRYRYKAHGVEALALRRGMDSECVISPYSSFLALALDPRAAVNNLRRLERRGMRGRFGFYEALDLTPGRCASLEGERVCTTMAHHAAMSLCAAANALCSGSITRRFMADARMAAFRPLLCERMDEGGVLLRRSKSTEESAERAPRAMRVRRGEKGQRGNCLLSNGRYTLAVSERGEQSASFGEIALSDARFGGVRLRLLAQGQSLQLMPSLARRWEMGEDFCRLEYETPFGRAALTLSVGTAECGTLYDFEPPAGARDAQLVLDFVPLLAPMDELLDHPAYARLGIRAYRRGGALLLRRIAKRGAEDLYLAAICSRAMASSAEDDCESESETLLRPHVTLRAAADAEHGALRFALCVATDAEEALESAKRLIASVAEQRGGFVRAASTLLGLSEAGVEGAMALSAAIRNELPREACARRELWRWGVSGDWPLLFCPGGAKEEEELIAQFCLLRALDVRSELVLTTSETGEYHQPTRERVARALSKVGLEALLDAGGGVHLCPPEAEEALLSRAVCAVGRERKAREPMPSLPERERSLRAEPEGSFDGEGVFSFQLPGRLPKKPWQNILWAKDCGWLLSECGSGWLWFRNAREGRLNPPPRYPESTRGSESLWADTPTGRVSLFAAEDGIPCRVRYCGAFARWEKEIAGREISLTGFLDAESGARVLLLSGASGLTISWRMELTLGAPNGAALRCGFSDGLVHAENPESFFPALRFLACVSAKSVCRCDYREPGMLLRFTAGEHEVLLCGCAEEETLRALTVRKNALAAYSAALRQYAARSGRFFLRSSDRALDNYMNGWCLTQVYARLEARTSLYQSGGAIGFRDQLQDAVNLLLVDEQSARERILDCCRHQYREGDVMHWWHAHPAGDRGVRTRCSDDLLWLCQALGDYVTATGERALLFERTPYLVSAPLSQDERDRYETAVPSGETDSVLEHALRALRCCVSRGFGGHGLPKMGAGDWNDSLSDCGGESVWLGFFLCDSARKMEKLLRLCGRREEAEDCAALGERMLAAAEGSFNGRWYERVYSAHGDFSRGGRRIDSIVQSWAVFCGAKHGAEALEYALCRLVDAPARIVKLLDPPFGPDEERFGYITAYGEGCRENGGQYTHAALWLARACFLSGRADAGREILDMLLPSGRGAVYGAEPYVLAADICAAEGHTGEALWSWYTGSAGWFFRCVTENLLGLEKKDGQIHAAPPACALFETHEIRVNGERIV